MLYFVALDKIIYFRISSLHGVVKNKIQLSKFKDPTGFIQQFMNRAASHLVERRSVKELCKMKDL